MKIIHSSDWHLGRSLYNRKRYDEFDAFLNHLAEYIEENAVDALIVAGDIFDTGTPSNRAQQLYYRFLNRVSASSCQHVVITAGNHDSPTFLNAPKEILKALDVSVIGAISDELEDEILVLKNSDGEDSLIVCAVPYLRDRDIRSAEAGETSEDKERKLILGIKEHYQKVCELAQEKQTKLGKKIPILATGHLFAAGGKAQEGDGVRDLYVGNLGQVTQESFPECIDYLALGHLHVPQKLGSNETRRYSGSPLPMSFGEAKQQKIFIEVEFDQDELTVKEINLPCFQKLVQVRGDWPTIEEQINKLKEDEQSTWIEVIYQGDEIISDLQNKLTKLTEKSHLEILRIQNKRLIERALKRMHSDETLDQLSESEVFKRCLTEQNVTTEQQDELNLCFSEILHDLHEEND